MPQEHFLCLAFLGGARTRQCSAEAALLSDANARRQMNDYDDQEGLIPTQRDLAPLAMASRLLRGADSGRP